MWWVAALRDGLDNSKSTTSSILAQESPNSYILFILARLHLSIPWISASVDLPNSFICSSLNACILPILVPLVSAHSLGGWPELHTGAMRFFSASVGWPHFDNSFRNYTGTTLGLGHCEHAGPRCHLSVNVPQIWGSSTMILIGCDISLRRVWLEVGSLHWKAFLMVPVGALVICDWLWDLIKISYNRKAAISS